MKDGRESGETEIQGILGVWGEYPACEGDNLRKRGKLGRATKRHQLRKRETQVFGRFSDGQRRDE